MKKKSLKKIKAESSVYSEFSVGLAIAWFSGGAAILFFPKGFPEGSLISGVIAMILSWISLRLAVQFRENGGLE